MSTFGRDDFRKTVSGRTIVMSVFAFALTLTAVLWVYWNLHTAPFLPLQQALAKEFPDSAPLVQGGQRKMHQGTPRILRITLRVDFDPKQDDPLAVHIADRVALLAGEYQDWQQYDLLEVHLFQLVPEREANRRTIEIDAQRLLTVVPAQAETQ